MPERTLTPAQRDQVVAFADAHGPKAAARRFGLPMGTIGSWQYRARARERRRQAKAEADRERAQELARQPVADPDADEATILRRMERGQCLRCGGLGRVAIPAVTRGSLVLRPARRIVCPNCGGPIRHLEVVEHGRDAWREAQAAAGDLGLGWSPDEWGLIRAGEVDPDGRRITGRPDT
jgi:hypothetical protein